MTIYKWRCPHCGYIHSEPSGTTEAEAMKSKADHISWCKNPREYTEKYQPNKDFERLVEKWI